MGGANAATEEELLDVESVLITYISEPSREEVGIGCSSCEGSTVEDEEGSDGGGGRVAFCNSRASVEAKNSSGGERSFVIRGVEVGSRRLVRSTHA